MYKKVLIVLTFLLPFAAVAEEKIPRLGSEPRGQRERREDRTKGHLLSEPLFTTAKKKNTTDGIGVNSYLWTASLETLAFMEKKKADPFGGLIITEWYVDPNTTNKRFKIEVIITGRELNSSALKISIFKQKKDSNGAWVATNVDKDTLLKFEETILTRARDLKVSQEIG
ncbi:MAG: DUF3576 domain-containing protein [Holosporaceae bacterium]|nr:MAG: DUF3576 domain-containing protein [Holosporaceae bacterium]